MTTEHRPDAWMCDGPHGRSAHIALLKLRPEEGCTLTPLYSRTHPDIVALVEAAHDTLPVLEAVQRIFAAEANAEGMVAGGRVDANLRAALAQWIGPEKQV